MDLCCKNKQNIKKYFNSKPKLERIESLVVCQDTHNDFDVNLLKYFSGLKNLMIADSAIQHFNNRMPKLDNLIFINISRTQLRSIKSDFFSNLSAIQLIDLRYNQLKYIERPVFHSDHVNLYLYGNLWNCTRNLKWIVPGDSHYDVIDNNRLMCSDPKYRSRPVVLVMSYKIALYKACREDPELKNCSCHISYLRLDEQREGFQPMFSVNCSSAGFYNFPKKLPDNTTTLFITHNNINSLDELCIKNSTYNEVQDIYLDYNRIRAVDVLENCVWFEKFRVLSLKGNLLEKLPAYAFRNSFEKSHHAMKLYLSENPWYCSCRLQPRVLKLCQKYDIIVDQKRIKCLNEKNPDHILGRNLMELTKQDVCKTNEFPLNKYEIMSVIFAILIALLFINLLYDYYRYKNHGKLPWIVLNSPLF